MSEDIRTQVDEVMAKVYAGGTVTREEAEFVVRAGGRWCKGPKKPGAEAIYAEARAASGNVSGAEKGYDLSQMDAVLREGCGADFNEVIVKFPFDGTEHLEPCPKCGQMISFRSPVFPVKD